MSKRFDGKVALITGGTSGIGVWLADLLFQSDDKWVGSRIIFHDLRHMHVVGS